MSISIAGTLEDQEWSNIVDHLEDECERLTLEVRRLKESKDKIARHHAHQIKGLRDDIEVLVHEVKTLRQRYE